MSDYTLCHCGRMFHKTFAGQDAYETHVKKCGKPLSADYLSGFNAGIEAAARHMDASKEYEADLHARDIRKLKVPT